MRYAILEALQSGGLFLVSVEINRVTLCGIKVTRKRRACGQAQRSYKPPTPSRVLRVQPPPLRCLLYSIMASTAAETWRKTGPDAILLRDLEVTHMAFAF